MSESVQVAAFEGGALRLLSPGESSGEVVLALPLNRLIVKVICLSEEEKADPVAVAQPILQAMSPYPDASLTVSVESVRETERGLVAIAAALPEDATDDIAEALDAQKLNVTRVDALALGQLRGLWGSLGIADGVRKLLLMKGPDCLSLFVIDGEIPCAVRAVVAEDDLCREILLSLLEAEDFCGPRALAEVVCVGDVATRGLETFAPVRRLDVGEDAGLVGVAERTLDEGALNALPASWREMLEETRFKAKLVRRMSVAGGVWLLVMGVIFGVPAVYDYLAGRQKDLCKIHARQYEEVKATKDKVEVVKKYSDHSRGALEVMKAVSDRLPQGIELDSWNFKRDEGVKVSGLADDENLVYAFKDAMSEFGVEYESETGEDGEATETRVGESVFQVVELNGPSSGKGGRQKFDLDCRYLMEEEE